MEIGWGGELQFLVQKLLHRKIKIDKRFKEITEQAKQYALDAMVKIADREQAIKVYAESYDTKFAELIILDCASFVGTQRNDIPGTGEEFESAIKYYYGLERK